MDEECLFSCLTLAEEERGKSKSLRDGEHLATFFRAFPYSHYPVINCLPWIRRLIITLFILHRNINLRSHCMVPLHKQQKQEDPVVEHHMTCLPLHRTFLLSLIFPFLIFCHTIMLQHVFTMLTFFSTARRAGSPISALCLYSSTRNNYRYYFWPYAPLPRFPFQVLRLISCCFLGTYLYDLTAYPSTNCWGRYVHDPKTPIGQSLTDACGIALR